MSNVNYELTWDFFLVLISLKFAQVQVHSKQFFVDATCNANGINPIIHFLGYVFVEFRCNMSLLVALMGRSRYSVEADIAGLDMASPDCCQVYYHVQWLIVDLHVIIEIDAFMLIVGMALTIIKQLIVGLTWNCQLILEHLSLCDLT